MNHEDFQGPGNEKSTVTRLVHEIESGAPLRVDDYFENPLRRKLIKNAILRSVARGVVNWQVLAEAEGKNIYQSRIVRVFNAFQNLFSRPAVAVEGTVPENDLPMRVMDYSPVVKDIFSTQVRLSKDYLGSGKSGPGVVHARRYMILENVESRGAADHFNKRLDQGNNSATRHTAALVNLLTHQYSDMKSLRMRSILKNSYGTAISPFMNISNEYFGRILESGSIYCKASDGAEILDPRMFPLTQLGESELEAVVPDWELISQSEVRLGVYTSIYGYDYQVPLAEVTPNLPTTGCPFQELVRHVYPNIVDAVIEAGRQPKAN